jgi:hypothetical protein
MSCFKLPRGLYEHINTLIWNFWWGGKEGKRRTCWVSWDQMVQPKYAGGLGFRDIELFNLALLARQALRALQEPTTLSSRMLKAIYFPESELLNAKLGSHPSQVWRAIYEGRDALKLGLISRIGTGDQLMHGRKICCPVMNDRSLWRHENKVHRGELASASIARQLPGTQSPWNSFSR